MSTAKKKIQDYYTTSPYGWIYVLTNKINSKVYVGKTKAPRTVNRRWSTHKCRARVLKRYREEHPGEKVCAYPIYNAIVKYGEENWTVEEIDTAYSLSELNKKEVEYITLYRARNPKKGYNLHKGGEGGLLDKRTRQKLSEIAKARMRDPAIRKHISETVKKTLAQKWRNDPEFVKHYYEGMKGLRKVVPNKVQFLTDVQNLTLNQLKAKYKMSCNTVYRNIYWILGKRIHTLTAARRYLKGMDIAEFYKGKKK